MGLRTSRPWSSAAARRLVARFPDAETVEQAVVCVADNLLEGIRCPPTDLPAVAARLGVVKFRSEPLPVAGELRQTDKTRGRLFVGNEPRS